MELDSHEDGAEQEAELHEQAESVSPTGVFFDRPGRINVLRLQLGQAGGFNVRQGDDLAHRHIGSGFFYILNSKGLSLAAGISLRKWNGGLGSPRIPRGKIRQHVVSYLDTLGLLQPDGRIILALGDSICPKTGKRIAHA